MEEKNEKVITAYKGFDKDLKCRGFQYKVGKEYEQKGKIVVCKNGFHACKNPFDVLGYYGDVLENRFCEVEQYGSFDESGRDKTASSKIKIKAEIGFVGLFKTGIEWLKEVTNPANEKRVSKSFSNNSGDDAQIGSSGDDAKIASSGNNSVICCAGNNSVAKAKVGSWITLSEWVYSDKKRRYVPKCVKTEYVDGERIKEDIWYKLIDGEFVEQD